MRSVVTDILEQTSQIRETHSTKLVMMETQMTQMVVPNSVNYNAVVTDIREQTSPISMTHSTKLVMMETRIMMMNVQTLVKIQHVEMGTYSQATTKNVITVMV